LGRQAVSQVKKIREIPSLLRRRAWRTLIDEESGDCGVPLARRGLPYGSEVGIDNDKRNGYNQDMRLRLNRKSASLIKGHPLTAQRRLILELLREAKEHIDAKELYRRASSKDCSISPATVYRSLNLFKQLSLVDERKLGKMGCCYEIKRAPEHQHLVCQGCGRVIEFESPLIRKLLDSVQREYSFNVTKAELCLEGYCEQCKEKTVPIES